MAILKRAIAVFLLLMAAAVIFLWITSPTLLVDNSDGNYPMWERLNWIMGLASIPIMLLVSIVRKARLCRQERAEGGGSAITRDYIEVNLCLAAAIVVTMWYYWNWFQIILPTDEDSLLLLEIHLGFWGFIHPVYVFLSLATASFLWRCAGRK